jgi:hypothetical protein
MPKQRQSTKTANSYESTRYNATKHGALSRVPVLPWENADEFTQLQDCLIKEYNPQGASEEHLVYEMANCIFRKQRVYQAENALIVKRLSNSSNYSLKETINLMAPNVDLKTSSESKKIDFKAVLHDTEPFKKQELDDHKKYVAQIQAVIDADLPYEEMLNQCPVDVAEYWHDWAKDNDDDYTLDAESFKEFLAKEVIEWCEEQVNEIQARPHLRQQIIGLAYNPDMSMDRLQRHETTLDRRFEKSLSILLKLQEVRAAPRSTPTIIDQAANSVL